MGLADVLNRRVRARKDDSPEGGPTESSSSAEDVEFEDENSRNESEGRVDHAQDKDTQSKHSGDNQSEV